MARYQGEYRTKLDEENPPEPEQIDPQLPTPNSAEEVTYAKRYADLRRHAQKREDELKAKIAQMDRQLVEQATTVWKLPKTEQELEGFYTQYPDGAAFIETIAAKIADRKVDALSSTYGEQLKELEKAKHMTEHEKAKQALIKLHPDFDTIRQDAKFHEWVALQPQVIQDSLYENDTDAHAAARAVDLYKSDMAKQELIAKPTRAKPDASAAAFVAPSKAASQPILTGDGKKIWKESEIKAIKPHQYTDDVDREVSVAMREGRVIMDLTRSR